MNSLLIKYIAIILLLQFYSDNADGQEKYQWKISSPIFEQGKIGSFDEVAVKDPSIVFYKNKWHLFYTARDKKEYTTAYVSAKEIEDLNMAKRYSLKQIRGTSEYGCAPHIFYFEPQKKWYLLFQNKNSNYQPAFSINTEMDNPESWSKSQNLLEKDTEKKWIDFWIIADDNRVYLFYTEAHNGVMIRSTKIKDFPKNWNKSKKVFNNVHEAVHVYKVIDKEEFHMIYELNTNGIRSFGLAKANQLEGPWQKVTDEYATANQLINTSSPWTEMISHGEVIRSGYNQLMEYTPKNCRWLIQGILKKDLNSEYPTLPWKLGLIQKNN